MNIDFIRPPAQTDASQALRISVKPGDVLCLYLNGHRLHVLAGEALVTWEGQEFRLQCGETAPFTSGKAPAVISACQQEQLEITVTPTP